MPLDSPYLAAANSAAERRSRALHRTIVAAPMLLLIALGLIGHLRPRAYPHPAGMRDYDARVLAYRDRVVAVAGLMEEDRQPTLDALEREARNWTAGYAAGTLVPIEPAAYEDHLRDGVRGEILRSGLGLASRLLTAAQTAVPQSPSEVARTSLLAAETVQTMRGAEMQALLQSLMVQRRALALLSKAWPSLPEAERARFRPRLARLAIATDEVDRIAAAEAAREADYARRQSLPAFGKKDSPEFATARRSVGMTGDRLRAFLR